MDEAFGQVALGECIGDADEAHESSVVSWSKVESSFERCRPYCVEDVKCKGHVQADDQAKHGCS